MPPHGAGQYGRRDFTVHSACITWTLGGIGDTLSVTHDTGVLPLDGSTTCALVTQQSWEGPGVDGGSDAGHEV
jgi:hypothetical protein